MVKIWILLFFLRCLNDCKGQTIAQVNSLSTTLLTGYNKHTRPTNDQTQTVIVQVSLRLVALRDFDEVLGKLSTSMVIEMNWNDQSMVWDSTANNGITQITVSQDEVWKPLLTVANPSNELKELGDKNWVTIEVNNDGTMNWEPFASLDTTCSIDTTHYPYDKQTCNIEMITFGYSDSQVQISVLSNTLDLQFYEDHATWEIVSTSVTKSTRSGLIPILLVTMVLKRLPTFVIVNFLIPILILAFLNPLVFLLPTDSGERIGYSITILLSLSVFMTILADFIPQNADPISLAAYMLVTLYISSAIMVIGAIVSVKVYFLSDTRPVHRVARAFVYICQLRCLRKSKTRVHAEQSESSINDNKEMDLINTKDTVYENNNTTATLTKDNGITWKDVSSSIDRFTFISMYTVILSVIFVFIGILQNGD